MPLTLTRLAPAKVPRPGTSPRPSQWFRLPAEPSSRKGTASREVTSVPGETHLKGSLKAIGSLLMFRPGFTASVTVKRRSVHFFKRRSFTRLIAPVTVPVPLLHSFAPACEVASPRVANRNHSSRSRRLDESCGCSPEVEVIRQSVTYSPLFEFDYEHLHFGPASMPGPPDDRDYFPLTLVCRPAQNARISWLFLHIAANKSPKRSSRLKIGPMVKTSGSIGRRSSAQRNGVEIGAPAPARGE